MRKIFVVVTCVMLMIQLTACKGEEEDVQLTPIEEVRASYEAECEQLRMESAGSCEFDDCVFAPFPEFDEFYRLDMKIRNVTVQEGWDIIVDYVTECGFADVTDFDNEIRDASGQFATLNPDGSPDEFAKVKEHFDQLDAGWGFYLSDRKNCYIQLGVDGIYGCSDGRITRYLQLDSKVSRDAHGQNQEDIVATYKKGTWDGVSYELMDGVYTIAEAVEMAEAFFDAGTPFPVADGVRNEVVQVEVFRMTEDKYGYTFIFRRRYEDIPISHGFYGAYGSDGGENPLEEDRKMAYMVDGTGVCAYEGTNASQLIIPVGTRYDSLLTLSEAKQYLVDQLASRLVFSVKDVELVYMKYARPDEEGMYHADLCWRFSGICLNEERSIDVYINAVTGELRYTLHKWYLPQEDSVGE